MIMSKNTCFFLSNKDTVYVMIDCEEHPVKMCLILVSLEQFYYNIFMNSRCDNIQQNLHYKIPLSI